MKKIINTCILLLLLSGCFNNVSTTDNFSNSQNSSLSITLKDEKNETLKLLNIDRENIKDIKIYSIYQSSIPNILLENEEIDVFFDCIDVGYNIKEIDIDKYNLQGVHDFRYFLSSYSSYDVHICLADASKEFMYIYKNYIYFKTYELNKNEWYVSKKMIRIEKVCELV